MAIAMGKSHKWDNSSVKTRTNLLVEITGLKACFAPKMVLETLVKGKDGENYSVATGRDGRTLWSGKTKLSRNPGQTRKFSSPWHGLSKTVKWKSARISYLFRVFSENRLPVEAVKPLVRLAIQIWNLKTPNFVGLTRKLIATIGQPLSRSTYVRDYSSNGLIPYIRKEVKSKDSNLGSVPLWDWRRLEPP